MRNLKNILVLFLLLLISFSSIVLFRAEAICVEHAKSLTWDDQSQNAEIQNPVSHFFLAIEGNNFTQVISQIHKLATGIVSFGRFQPFNPPYSGYRVFRLLFNFSSPVPIFIKGHALLN